MKNFETLYIISCTKVEVLKIYIKNVNLNRISLLQHFKIYNRVFKIIRQTFIRQLSTSEENQAAFAIHATIRNESKRLSALLLRHQPCPHNSWETSNDTSKCCIIFKTGTFNTNQWSQEKCELTHMQWSSAQSTTFFANHFHAQQQTFSIKKSTESWKKNSNFTKETEGCVHSSTDPQVKMKIGK